MKRFEPFVLKNLVFCDSLKNEITAKNPNPPLCKIISESWRDKKIGEACIQIPVQHWLHTWFRGITHKYDWQCLLLNKSSDISSTENLTSLLLRSVTKENSQAKNGATNIWQFYFISNIAKKPSDDSASSAAYQRKGSNGH